MIAHIASCEAYPELQQRRIQRIKDVQKQWLGVKVRYENHPGTKIGAVIDVVFAVRDHIELLVLWNDGKSSRRSINSIRSVNPDLPNVQNPD
jgi:hypothetical protein